MFDRLKVKGINTGGIMLITKKLCDKIIEKYSNSYNVDIYIADSDAKIISSTQRQQYNSLNKTALYGLNTKKSFLIESENQSNINSQSTEKNFLYCVPLFYGNKSVGITIVEGLIDEIQNVGNSIKMTFDIFFEHKEVINKVENEDTKEAILIKGLLLEQQNKKYMNSLIKSFNLDEKGMYSVIYLQLESRENIYFNSNLNLGYSESIEDTKIRILQKIKSSIYLTAKDIVCFYEENELVILKSFLSIDNLTKIYTALDIICNQLLRDLADFNIYVFKISYGNICEGLCEVKNSYKEAKEIISLGTITNSDKSIFKLEDFMFENVCNYLHPQIVNKLIVPYIMKLTKKDGTVNYQLIKIGEAFVDNCMSYVKTSQALFMHRNTIDKNLEKYTMLTGLNPNTNFHDAFLVKMIAIYTQYFYTENKL